MIEFNNMIDLMEKFLNKNIKKNILLENMETIENSLLDLEEENKDNKKRELIIEVLNIIDNIYILLDEDDTISNRELEHEIIKLKEIERKFNFHNENEALLNNKEKERKENITYTDETDITPLPSGKDMKKDFSSINKEQLMVAQGKYKFHPDMKSRLPEEQKEMIGEIDNIELKSSPIYNLLNSEELYLSGNAGPVEFSKELDNIINEVILIKQETTDEETNNLLEEILSKINEIEKYLSHYKEIEDIISYLEELKELNRKYIECHKKTISSEKKEGIEDLINHLMKRMSDEDAITPNYVEIENTAFEFIEGKITEEEYYNLLNDMRDIVVRARIEYEETAISPDEWTLEVATGDKLLTEGLNEFEKSLIMLTECSGEKNEEKINKALDILFDANKKLILNQHLAKYIDEMIDTISCSPDFKKFSFKKEETGFALH